MRAWLRDQWMCRHTRNIVVTAVVVVVVSIVVTIIGGWRSTVVGALGDMRNEDSSVPSATLSVGIGRLEPVQTTMPVSNGYVATDAVTREGWKHRVVRRTGDTGVAWFEFDYPAGWEIDVEETEVIIQSTPFSALGGVPPCKVEIHWWIGGGGTTYPFRGDETSTALGGHEATREVTLGIEPTGAGEIHVTTEVDGVLYDVIGWAALNNGVPGPLMEQLDGLINSFHVITRQVDPASWVWTTAEVAVEDVRLVIDVHHPDRWTVESRANELWMRGNTETTLANLVVFRIMPCEGTVVEKTGNQEAFRLFDRRAWYVGSNLSDDMCGDTYRMDTGYRNCLSVNVLVPMRERCLSASLYDQVVWYMATTSRIHARPVLAYP